METIVTVVPVVTMEAVAGTVNHNYRMLRNGSTTSELSSSREVIARSLRCGVLYMVSHVDVRALR